ncbi:uncharacterized protein EDB93DRAFT_1271920 [Suillus bovinus]|uniref:uncharacterized protein n=1 Tax=Suillus bovinus TaxID=48563 RepID=UPI001B85D261|nr:uncharacterized protein EDB93DRAFT_1271920 [Suillus bovinus]KAG2126968.1 hypothetical protein EDB93DRAFT_1271920 [Suillus bovinus]
MFTRFSASGLQVVNELYLYSMEGKQLAPDFVGATEVNGRRAQLHFVVFLTGFTNPGIVARYDFDEPGEDKCWSIYWLTIMERLVPDEFSAEQVCPFLQVPFLNLMADLRQRGGSVRVRVGGNTQETATLVASTPDSAALEKDYAGIANPTAMLPLVFTTEIIKMMAEISALTNVYWYMGVPFNDTQYWHLQIAEAKTYFYLFALALPRLPSCSFVRSRIDLFGLAFPHLFSH